jgi:hypothetical protein
MSFNENRRSSALLIGNTSLTRSAAPLLRTAQRRSDPDINSNIPYYPLLGGKTLSIVYSTGSNPAVSRDIAFTSDGYASAIAAINVVDPTNLVAVDLDGFLGLRNLNSGGVHYIKIVPFSGGAAFDAAKVLGLATEPSPGFASYAGEFTSAPGIRSQKNPQGTALLGRDEDLTTGAVNRAIAAVLQYSDLLKVDLDRIVIGFVEKEVTLGLRNGVLGFLLDDPTLLLPVNAMGLGEEIPDPTGHVLDPFFEFINYEAESTLYNNDLSKVRVVEAYYDKDTSTPYSYADGFAVWGTPDGKSIYQPGIGFKTKHTAVGIDSIIGGVVYCPGATFSSLFVSKGDPVLIESATNVSPFDHNGWFAVDEIIDEEHLLLRPMSRNESIPTGATLPANKPSELNSAGSGFGNLSVHFGAFVPCSRVFFQVVSDWTNDILVRMAVGRPLRDVLIDQFSLGRTGNQNTLGACLHGHMTDPTDAHAATAIGGFTSTETWKDGSTITGADLKLTIENILTDLKSVSAGAGGTEKIGGDDITISGAAPNNLVAASLHNQLVDLLTKLQTHVLDHEAHAGGTATFTKNPASPVQLWKDGTTVADGITLIQAITNIITALGGNPSGSDGAAKINTGARDAWKGGRLNPADISVLAALNKIINDLGAPDANDDGAKRIGAMTMAESGQTACGDSLRTQLNYLATMWGKTNRAQTWDATQTLNGPSGDSGQTAAAINTTVQPTDRKLLWSITTGAGNPCIRFFSSNPGTLEITSNVYRYLQSSIWYWREDTDGMSAKLKISNGVVSVYTHHPSDDANDYWLDTQWREVADFDFSDAASHALRLGQGLLSGIDSATKKVRSAIPRIEIVAPSSAIASQTPIDKVSGPTYGTKSGRQYTTYGWGRSWNWNAYWDPVGLVWKCDEAGDSARMVWDGSNLQLDVKTTPSVGPITWDANRLRLNYAGYGVFNWYPTVLISGSPDYTYASGNVLAKWNKVACWGVVETGAGPTVQAGWNVTSCHYHLSGFELSVNLGMTFALYVGSNYRYMIFPSYSMWWGTNIDWYISYEDGNTFNIRLLQGGVAQDLSASVYYLGFMVLGVEE